MIEVTVNLSHATAAEVEAFYSLAGVGRAMDSLSHAGEPAGVRLQLQQPPHEPINREGSAHAVAQFS